MRILIVDDELDVQHLFRQRFRRELRNGQISMDFAHSGEDALKFLEENDADSIVHVLSDINMPGMDGLELLKSIKEHYSEMKVFMITAYDNENYYEQAREYGCDDYLTKPIDFQNLKDKLLKSA